MPLTDHPNIKFVHPDMHTGPDGTVKAIVRIDTDLELDALRKGYDSAKVDSLLNTVVQHLESHEYTDEAHIRTVPDSSSSRIVQVPKRKY